MTNAKTRSRDEPALLQGLLALVLAAGIALGAIALSIVLLERAAPRERHLASAAQAQAEGTRSDGGVGHRRP
jgi:hypothetical protein